MSAQMLVCSFDENSIERFHRKALVVQIDDIHLAPHVNRVVNRNNKLHCLFCSLDGALTSIEPQEDWIGIPLIIQANRLGIFKVFADYLPIWRQLNLRVYLSTDMAENVTSLRILSSLGIHCGVVFGAKPIDWDSVNDLMHYAIYNTTLHASIEPFLYVSTHYHPDEFTDFSATYFNDPTKYLHIDAEGHIALTREHLERGEFISKDLEELKVISENERYREFLTSWQNYFLKTEGCAYCSAWRVCLGKFSHSCEQNPGCEQCFSDLIDGAEFTQSREQKDVLCQL